MAREEGLGKVVRFRGLLYEPVNENEVLILFGLLLPHLDDEFVIEQFSRFPDCTARRNGQQVGIEFEVDSRKFYVHEHDKDPLLPKCDLIVCWKNPFDRIIKVQGHPIEILELSKVVEDKKLNLIFAGPRPQPDEWDKEKFLDELRKNLGDRDRYRWVKALLEFCEGRPQFVIALGKGAHEATLGFHIKRWLSQQVGVPTPILFYADGSISFDYRNMPKPVEKELRSRTKEYKKRWHKIAIQDQETFNAIVDALRWLADAVAAGT